MEQNIQSSSSNDYAVAKVLNEHIAALIIMILIADNSGLPENYEIKDLNKAYVLLANELQRVYDRNSDLSAIEPDPVWRRFDVLEASTWDINEYFEDPDNNIMQLHIAKVNRLWIISGEKTPNLSPEQTNLIEYADQIRGKYGKMLDDVRAENKIKQENDWHISEYTLTYKPDGTILVNGVLKLKKAHAGAATERLIEQAINNPNKLFEPNLGQTSRSLSTIISSAGFTPILRQLFFPTASKTKGVVFRPTITRKQADADNIDTTLLDINLKELGAVIEHGKSL